jgi:hypothetical protein
MAIEFSHLRLRIRYWTFGVNKNISERQSQTVAKGDLQRGLQARRFGGCQRQKSLHQFKDLRLSHIQLLLILHRRTNLMQRRIASTMPVRGFPLFASKKTILNPDSSAHSESASFESRTARCAFQTDPRIVRQAFRAASLVTMPPVGG